MAGPNISTTYDTVVRGTDSATNGLPPGANGRGPGTGVDPRLTTAVNDTEEQNRKGSDKVRDRADKTKKYTKGLSEIQERGGRDVSGTRGSDTSGAGKGGGKSMPEMPQVPQQSTPQQSTPQAQPAAATPQASTPQASTPAPGGVSTIKPEVLAALVALARKRQQEAAESGESITPSRSTTTTPSGQGSASSPQKPQPLDVSQVSLEKYAGGPLSEQQTADVIDQALTINGIPNDPSLRAQWQELYQHMAQNESGRDPNAGNGWDSNATGSTQEDGLPANSSRGIWQCIPTTFAAYHMAGTSNSIYDPVASAAASMNYVMETYKVSPDGSGLDAFMQRQGVGGGSYQGY